MMRLERILSMAKRWDLERASELFKSRGCKLLETEYVNSKTKMRYIAKCGHEHSCSIDNFAKGKGDYCRKCRYKIIGEKQMLGTDFITKSFESEGCKVIDPGNGTNDCKIKYIALCGHENSITYSHFAMGGGRICNKCSRSIQYEYDYVKECFENADCELLETEYINCKTPMRYIAQCGHESTITFDAFLNSLTTPKRCSKCLKITKHDIVEDRNKGIYHQWRNKVMEKYSGTCVACGRKDGRIETHHLVPYHADPSKRFDVSNGVVLCFNCHVQFHKDYGWRNNTPEQFYEWLKGIPR